MKFCSQCGGQMADEAMFCSACGARTATPAPVAPVVPVQEAAPAVPSYAPPVDPTAPAPTPAYGGYPQPAGYGAATAVAPKGKGLKIALWILIPLILVAGIGAALYFFVFAEDGIEGEWELFHPLDHNTLDEMGFDNIWDYADTDDLGIYMVWEFDDEGHITRRYDADKFYEDMKAWLTEAYENRLPEVAAEEGTTVDALLASEGFSSIEEAVEHVLNNGGTSGNGNFSERYEVMKTPEATGTYEITEDTLTMNLELIGTMTSAYGEVSTFTQKKTYECDYEFVDNSTLKLTVDGESITLKRR